MTDESGLKPQRVGLYIEVTCPGVDATDAISRAVHALERATLPVYPAFTATEPLRGHEGVTVLEVHSAEGVEAAALRGSLMVVPRSRMTQLLRKNGGTQ